MGAQALGMQKLGCKGKGGLGQEMGTKSVEEQVLEWGEKGWGKRSTRQE